MLPKPPKLVLVLCLLTSLAAAGLALGCGALAAREVMENSKLNQAWFLVVFMVTALIGAACAFAAGLGRFRPAPALAMVCAGMPMIFGGLLGEPSLVARLMGNVTEPLVIHGVAAKLFCAPLAVCGGAMCLWAALTVLARRPRAAYRYVGQAILAAVPLGASFFFLATGRGGAILAHMPTVAVVFTKLLLVFVVIAFISISLHCAIRAFETGKAEGQDAEPGRG